MIVVAIGIAVIAIVIMGTFIAYSDGRDRVQRQQEESSILQNERIREEVKMEQKDDLLNMESMEMQGDPVFNGMMVVCDDGTRHTLKMQDINKDNMEAEFNDKMRELKIKCQ